MSGPTRWRGEAHRQAVDPLRDGDRRPRRTPRGLRGLVMRPATPIGAPPPRPGRRTADRREGPRDLHDLPGPRDRAARTHPEAVVNGVLGLLRHQPIEQRRHRSRERPHRAPSLRRPRIAPDRRRTHQPPPRVRRSRYWYTMPSTINRGSENGTPLAPRRARQHAHRTAALAPWLQHYNTQRRHSALGGHPPISRRIPT